MKSRAKAVRISRRTSTEFKRPVRSFSIATGELLWASNQLHMGFASVFALLVARENLAVGFSIWHVAPSDSVQRQMLAALVEVRFQKGSKMRTSLIWAKECADKLATIRNDAAHMATAFRTDSDPFKLVVADIGNAPNRTKRLTKSPNLQRTFRLAKGDLIQLSGYVYALFFRITVPTANYPWPKKPNLKSV
jgi:hypothetical protein